MITVVDRFETGRGLPDDPEERRYVDPAAVRLKLAKALDTALDDCGADTRRLCQVVRTYAWLVGAHVPVAVPREVEDPLPMGIPDWMGPRADDPKPEMQ